MEKDIGKIQKNDITEIVVRIDDFGGKKGLTIREFTTSERYTGFTKSGTRIAAEHFKNFKHMINSIDEKDLEPSVSEQTETPQPTHQTHQTHIDSPKQDSPKKPATKKKKDVEPEELF